MKLIRKDSIIQFVEKRSQFIGYAFYVESKEESEEILTKLWKEHRKCTHICTASHIGLSEKRGEFDDNGEPSLTAGYPMLQILETEDIRQVLICAVRYFGGIKLGKGGLIRAYTKTAQLSLEAAGLKEVREAQKWHLSYDYSHHGSVEYILQEEKVLGLEPIYTSNVQREIYIEKAELCKKLMDISDGKIDFTYKGKYYLDPTKKNMELEKIK
ncbi:MAG TPA: YigZ family protein [Clostridia bacterium]|nr:YigZ family protein [Clostridia bacterium]